MADYNAALVQQFLNIPVTEWETVVQPNGMLDDGYGKAVAVGLDVGHCGSAYPEPVKTTQPFPAVLRRLVRAEDRDSLDLREDSSTVAFSAARTGAHVRLPEADTVRGSGV